MADPFSLIALGAGIGGIASKFAEKVWESGERWLAARFGEHSEKARAHARENAGAFLLELADRVQEMETSGRIEAESLSTEQEHPQFSATLQSALLRAAQTDNPDKHILLARLIAERLATQSESIIALASQMAVDAIGLATQRQLALLALCSFLEDVRPRTPVREYWMWLDSALEPFTDLSFYTIDAMHLVALSCATFDPTSEKDLGLTLGIKVGILGEDAFEQSVYFEWLKVLWVEGLAGVQLTSVGSLVGALAFDRITGARTGLPKWYGG